MIQQIKIRN